MVVNKKQKVVTMEDIISKQNNETEDNNKVENTEVKNTTKKIVKKKIEQNPRGKPVSGRVWKTERKRFNSIIKTRGIRNSFEKKEALRKELLRVKELSKAAKGARDAEKEEKKERRRKNLKRQEENRKKSEVVQVITNTSKIKKMKKKHLRSIEKRDVTKVEK